MVQGRPQEVSAQIDYYQARSAPPRLSDISVEEADACHIMKILSMIRSLRSVIGQYGSCQILYHIFGRTHFIPLIYSAYDSIDFSRHFWRLHYFRPAAGAGAASLMRTLFAASR